MRRLLLVLFLGSAFRAAGQSLPPIPERIVSIDCEARHTDDVLHDIAAQGKFEVAWNSNLFDPAKPVTLHVHNITVRRAIYLIFGNAVTFKVSGNYLVLVAGKPLPPAATGTPPKKKETVVTGYTTDAATGKMLANVSVYDSSSLASALSDNYGFYSLKVGGSKPVRIKVSCENYIDTFIVVSPGTINTQDIALRPVPPPPPVVVADTTQPMDSIIPPLTVENYRFLDSLLGFKLVQQSRNMGEVFRRGGQVSLIPGISTNGKLGGSVVNHVSLNLIAGYTGGTRGLEIGGVMNVDRQDVRWVQIGGAANIVGGDVKGLQVGGAFNFDLGSVKGVQVGGGVNVLLDTLEGVQLAGGVNLIRGPVFGLQMAGGVNVVTRDLDGFQLAGGTNFTLGSVNKFQGAGGLNYAQSVRGLQLAGGANIALHELNGGQVAAGMNYAENVKGLQLAAGLNLAWGVEGTQAGTLNMAREVKGLQIGIVNIAGKCTEGNIVGLLSIVPQGLHELEISTTEKGFVQATVHTGIPKFYNIFSFGIDPGYPSRKLWTLGYGFGHRFLLSPHFNLALDLTAHHVCKNRFSNFTSEWVQLAFTTEWRPVKNVAIAAGPVFHYYVRGNAEDQLALFHPKPLFENEPVYGYHATGWIGLTVAMRFF